MSADDDVPDDAVPPSRHHVTFGPAAVVVAFSVGLSVLASAFAVAWGPEGGAGIFLVALWYGLGVGLVTGLPLGIVVGLLLRPVRNQWVHVAVFLAVFTLAPLVVITLLSPSRVILENLPIALIIGAAGALARISVWKLVRVR